MTPTRRPAHASETPTAGRRVWQVIKEFVIVVASALVLSLILKTFFIQSFWIPSSSMEDTLQEGDRILVTKWRPGPLDLRHGDVVVFRDPGGWLNIQPGPEPTGLAKFGTDALTFVGLLPEDSGEHLVKRIVGMPGDTVECCDPNGFLLVNGEPLVEPYVKPGVDPSNQDFSITVPDEYVWLMGDNRSNSADSRNHQGRPGGGSVPIANVVGTVFVTVWPIDNWTGIGNPFGNAADED